MRATFSLLLLAALTVSAGCPSEIAGPGKKKPVDEDTEPPRLFVDPPFGLGFDCVTIGCDVERRMVVENRGGGEIALIVARLAVGSSSDFALRTGSGARLPLDNATKIIITKDAPLELFVRYVPTDGESDSGTVTLDWHDATIDFDDAVLQRVELPLSTRAIGDAVATLTTPRINFGFVEVGDEAVREIVIDNTGTGGVLGVGPVSLAEDTPDVFAEPTAGDWGEQFANPGQSATVRIAFRPTDVGTFTGAIEVRSNDGANPALVIEVVGTSIVEPRVSLSTELLAGQNTLDFGAIRIGTSRTLPLTIHNAGGAPLSVTPSVELGALVLAQAGAPVTAPIEIPALESVTLSVTWTPTFGGAFTGRLSVSANDPSRGFTTINVIGFANAPRLSAPVANIDFGTVVQGWTTPARSFTLRNDGQGELTINSITFDQGSASQIRFVEVPTLPIKLSPNDPPISVSVIMDATILGTLGATVLVGSDGVDGPLGTGGVGRLEAGGVVVTCEQGCPIQNGTPSCAVDNECRIATCNTRFHNANNNINDGCECNEDPVNGSPNVFRDVGSQCGDTGVDLGTVSDSGSELIVTGTLHSLTDTDLYFIRFNDGSGNDYGARVRFLSGPSGMRIIPRFTDDSDPCGLPSGQAITPGQTREGGGCSSFLCTGNDSENGSFRVEWAPGASPQCGTYRISFDANANY